MGDQLSPRSLVCPNIPSMQKWEALHLLLITSSECSRWTVFQPPGGNEGKPSWNMAILGFQNLNVAYWFSRAAETKCHRPGDLNYWNLFSHSSRGWMSWIKHWWGWLLLREEYVPGLSFGLVRSLFSPCCLYILFPLCAHSTLPVLLRTSIMLD